MLPPNYLDIEQRTAPWYEARLGCVTSVRAHIAHFGFLKRKSGEKTKGQESESRYKLKIELLCEMVSREPSEHYVSQWMEKGMKNEPLARAAYQYQRGVLVDSIGFVTHPTIKMAGASPDGLVGDDGLAEFKSPKKETHMMWRVKRVIPEIYRSQMLWQLACASDRTHHEFVSHVPDLPERLQTFIVPLEKTDQVAEEIARMEDGVRKFLAEVEEMRQRLEEDAEGCDPVMMEQLRQSVAIAKKRKRQKQVHVISAEDRQYIHDNMVP